MLDANEKNLSIYSKNVLKSEMGKKLIRVAELAEKLDIDAHVLSNKIGRGTFSSGFFIKVLQALEVTELFIPPKSSQGYDIFKKL